MWIVLNPRKAHRFTTKGINLHKSAPTAFVDPDTSSEVLAHIERAIAEGKILKIEGNSMKGMIIPKQAKIEDLTHEDTEKTVSTKCEKNEDGVLVTTITMSGGEDDETEEKPAPKQGGVIITPISWSERDEDED